MAGWSGKVIVELFADDEGDEGPAFVEGLERATYAGRESAAAEVRVKVDAVTVKNAVRQAFRQAAITVDGWAGDPQPTPISETPMGELHFQGYSGRASATVTLTDELGRERLFELPLTVRTVGGQITFVPDLDALSRAVADAVAEGRFGTLSPTPRESFAEFLRTAAAGAFPEVELYPWQREFAEMIDRGADLRLAISPPRRVGLTWTQEQLMRYVCGLDGHQVAAGACACGEKKRRP